MRATQANDEPIISPLTAWTYRHQARRLRHHFRHDPIGLHLSLRALAVKANQASGKPGSESWNSPRRIPVARPGNSPADPGRQAACHAAARPDSSETAVDPMCQTAAALQTPADAVEKFSVLVRTMLGEGILRYSRRKALMRQAKKFGIKPFEASLLIATVEHRMRDEPGNNAYTLRPARSWSVLVGVISLLLLETAVVGLLAMVLL